MYPGSGNLLWGGCRWNVSVLLFLPNWLLKEPAENYFSSLTVLCFNKPTWRALFSVLNWATSSCKYPGSGNSFGGGGGGGWNVAGLRLEGKLGAVMGSKLKSSIFLQTWHRIDEIRPFFQIIKWKGKYEMWMKARYNPVSNLKRLCTQSNIIFSLHLLCYFRISYYR